MVRLTEPGVNVCSDGEAGAAAEIRLAEIPELPE
jgi:hypothetical protein